MKKDFLSRKNYIFHNWIWNFHIVYLFFPHFAARCWLFKVAVRIFQKKKKKVIRFRIPKRLHFCEKQNFHRCDFIRKFYSPYFDSFKHDDKHSVFPSLPPPSFISKVQKSYHLAFHFVKAPKIDFYTRTIISLLKLPAITEAQKNKQKIIEEKKTHTHHRLLFFLA